MAERSPHQLFEQASRTLTKLALGVLPVALMVDGTGTTASAAETAPRTVYVDGDSSAEMAAVSSAVALDNETETVTTFVLNDIAGAQPPSTTKNRQVVVAYMSASELAHEPTKVVIDPGAEKLAGTAKYRAEVFEEVAQSADMLSEAVVYGGQGGPAEPLTDLYYPVGAPVIGGVAVEKNWLTAVRIDNTPEQSFYDLSGVAVQTATGFRTTSSNAYGQHIETALFGTPLSVVPDVSAYQSKTA
jgi:hypothetical protein